VEIALVGLRACLAPLIYLFKEDFLGSAVFTSLGLVE
jgi:hypothetical protein